jgi:hypothetical protein
MKDVKHFNIQLLCTALILITATNTYSTNAEKAVLISFDKDATRTLKQITTIKSRWGLWFGLIALGEAIYIANDKNPYGIATTVKDNMKKILEQSLLNKITTVEAKEDNQPAASTTTKDLFHEEVQDSNKK